MPSNLISTPHRMVALVIFALAIAVGGMALAACGPTTHKVRFHPMSVMVLAPAPAPAPAPAQPKKIQISERIQFKQGSARLRSRSHRVLDQVATILKTRSDIQLVEIQGHTDSKGRRTKNLRLSLRRAHSVREYLVRQGVAEARLQCSGHGPDLPVTSNVNRRGRRRNRRVEFIIKKRNLNITAQSGQGGQDG